MGSYEADRKAELKRHKNRLLENDYINKLPLRSGDYPRSVFPAVPGILFDFCQENIFVCDFVI